MKKIFRIFLIVVMFICIIPVDIFVNAEANRAPIYKCDKSKISFKKTGEKLNIYTRLGFGMNPGDYYTVSSGMVRTISTSASSSVLDGLVSAGISTSISTRTSIGVSVTNRGSSHSEAAIWVSYDVYDVTEWIYIGNGSCQVTKSSVSVPDYYIYGYENSY